MRGLILLLAVVALLFVSLPDSADAGGFAVFAPRTTVIQSNGFNATVVQNRGLLGLRNDTLVVNNGFGNAAVLSARGFNRGNVVVGNFNRANVVVASPLAFNAFGTATVIDQRANVFQVDPFGNSVLVRGGVVSPFAVRTFGGGCR